MKEKTSETHRKILELERKAGVRTAENKIEEYKSNEKRDLHKTKLIFHLLSSRVNQLSKPFKISSTKKNLFTHNDFRGLIIPDFGHAISKIKNSPIVLFI